MAKSNTSLRVAELDFFSIKSNLKDYLRGQDRFSDFDFDGAGLDAILELLAYNTHYMGIYLNMVSQEMFLDTAQNRDSILSHAKLTNYVPTSKLASTAVVNVYVTPSQSESQNTQAITLQKYTKLLADNDDGEAYSFIVMQSKSATKSNGRFVFANVVIQQGEVITNQFVHNDTSNPQRVYNIPTANVDTTTIQVIVQESTTNTTHDVYTQAEDVTEITANSTVFFVEESPESNGTFSIYLGDGYLGKKPRDGNILIVTYLDTLGKQANKSKRFTCLEPIDGFSDNISIATVGASAGGASKESIETIRFRAPLFYTVQNRCVTKNDYEALLLKDYPNIEAISVWGGEDNDPVVYGRVYISLKPKEGFWITTEEKERIKTEVIAGRSVVAITPEIVDPEYLYLIFQVNVNYDPLLTNFDADQLKSLIRETILDYRDTELNNFRGSFRPSLLARQIDFIDPSIKNCEINFYLQKRFEPLLGTKKTYNLQFRSPLKNGGVFDKMYSYPTFSMYDSSRTLREVKIEEITETLTGVSAIKVTNAGAGYDSVPLVTILGDGVGATAEAHLTNGKVDYVTLLTEGTGYTKATAAFSGGGDGLGASAVVSLDANRATLQAFYVRPTGEKVIVDSNVGKIYYNIGKITLTNFQPIEITENDQYDDTWITLNVRPANTVIQAARNQIITIDENDSSSIQITMVEEE